MEIFSASDHARDEGVLSPSQIRQLESDAHAIGRLVRQPRMVGAPARQ